MIVLLVFTKLIVPFNTTGVRSNSSLANTVEHEKRKLTAREKRFLKFASVEYNGQIYMTPQDFLDSVVEGEPRPRFKRKKLSDVDVKTMMRRMPKLHRNNEKFFRGLGSKGIISFSEYLFLLTILIKPQSGFKAGFCFEDLLLILSLPVTLIESAFQMQT